MFIFIAQFRRKMNDSAVDVTQCVDRYEDDRYMTSFYAVTQRLSKLERIVA